MNTILRVISILLLSINQSLAQVPHTWVASSGSDTAACTRIAPCATFNGALAQTSIGGSISCVDDGVYGGPNVTTITQSVIIDCSGKSASIEVSGDNGINVTAGPTSHVSLSGISIVGINNLGLIGILANGGATLQFEKGSVSGFRGGSAIGIDFIPPASTTGSLFVSNSSITNNSTGARISPDSTGMALASFDHDKIEGNGVGLISSGNGNHANGVNVVVTGDTIIAGNSSHGLVSLSNEGGGMSILRVDQATIVGNGGDGVFADGIPAYVVMSMTTVTRNIVGLAIAEGGSICSFGNNAVNGNTTDGTTNCAMTMR